MKLIRYTSFPLSALLPIGVFAQDLPTPTNVAGSAQSTPATTWLPNTLFKLGTGLGRNTGYGAYSGLVVPIILGAEHQLNPKFSVYGNLAPRMRFRRHYLYENEAWLSLAGIGIDLGGRYYYNQEKRERLGRAHGSFVGNYLALQAGSDLYTYKDRGIADSRRHYHYDYSTLIALWGMQRRIGQWGLFDGSAGAGLRDFRYRYIYNPDTGNYSFERRLDLMLEINARISLAH